MRFIIENCFVSYKGHKNTYFFFLLLFFFLSSVPMPRGQGRYTGSEKVLAVKSSLTKPNWASRWSWLELMLGNASKSAQAGLTLGTRLLPTQAGGLELAWQLDDECQGPGFCHIGMT